MNGTYGSITINVGHNPCRKKENKPASKRDIKLKNKFLSKFIDNSEKEK